MGGDGSERSWLTWLFIEHRPVVWLVGSIPLIAMGLGWSIRMGDPGPLYSSLVMAALLVVSDAFTWRKNGKARRRYALAQLPPPPLPPPPTA